MISRKCKIKIAEEEKKKEYRKEKKNRRRTREERRWRSSKHKPEIFF